MNNTNLNICQVSLNRDIPLIIENSNNFKKLYSEEITYFIVCPHDQIDEFRKKLRFEKLNIIDEEEIIKFSDFKSIYKKLNIKINYKDEFNLRLKWYYQQALKITFALNFIKNKHQNLVIWDADTVILKKIDFFRDNVSIKYGNFFEYHKDYYETNKEIFDKVPKYFISFLNQFIAMSVSECNFFLNNYLKDDFEKKDLGFIISKLIFRSIFNKHKIYKGSLFSEYEFLGQSNYILNNVRQKPILFLRFGLNGKLTVFQNLLAKTLGYRHVTYEHAHTSNNNLGMLNRNQNWIGFFKIIFKNLTKFYLKCIIHIFMYNLNKQK
jgi:hypothetical protein